MLTKLVNLPEHICIFYLKRCFRVPKFIYFLRYYLINNHSPQSLEKTFQKNWLKNYKYK